MAKNNVQELCVSRCETSKQIYSYRFKLLKLQSFFFQVINFFLKFQTTSVINPMEVILN